MARPTGMERLDLNVEKELKHQFKVYCIINRMSITECITKFIRDCVKENPDVSKKSKD